jgi:hypothetical protein
MKTKAIVAGIMMITAPASKLYRKFAKDGVMSFDPQIWKAISLIILSGC